MSKLGDVAEGGLLFIICAGCSLIQHAFRSKIVSPKQSLVFRLYSDHDVTDTLAVDCGHPSCPQITHHLKNKKVRQLADIVNRGDSSTDGVLNAIRNNSPYLRKNAFVMSNHFDIDSFLSVWCAMNQQKALEFEDLLREAAKIGDFRELTLNNEFQYRALRIVCWLNSEERRIFYKPFERTISKDMGEEDGASKFHHFLPRLQGALEDPDSIRVASEEEYQRVLREYVELHTPDYCDDTKITTYKTLSLVVVRAANPLHYYSLFSCSAGVDVVLSLYCDQRYELEIKYTTMIDLATRNTLPRVELTKLAEQLNKLENQRYQQLALKDRQTRFEENMRVLDRYRCTSEPCDDAAIPTSASDIAELQFLWRADRITDSGPIMRLDYHKRALSKAQRYGHPFGRPIFRSLISGQEMEEICVAYFAYAYKGIAAKMDWEWNELHAFNKSIEWSSSWAPVWLE